MPLWTMIDDTPLREDGEVRRRTYRTSVPGGWLVLISVATAFADGSPSHEDNNAATFVPDPQNKWRIGSQGTPAPTPAPTPGPTDNGGTDQGGGDAGGSGEQNGGVPRQVLADALTASGFQVQEVDVFLDHIEAEIRAYIGGVNGPADVRSILDDAVLGYGGSEYGKFTDAALDLFVASLLASGITFPDAVV